MNKKFPPGSILQPLELPMRKARNLVENSEDIKILTHIDCDGISAGAILSSILDRLEIDHEVEFISLDMIPELKAVGIGAYRDIYDLVVVDIHTYERSKSHDVAQEIAQVNAKLVAEGRPYLILGVGRWGSVDPWLGIPRHMGSDRRGLHDRRGRFQGTVHRLCSIRLIKPPEKEGGVRSIQ